MCTIYIYAIFFGNVANHASAYHSSPCPLYSCAPLPICPIAFVPYCPCTPLPFPHVDLEGGHATLTICPITPVAMSNAAQR